MVKQMVEGLKHYYLFAVDGAGVATATYEYNCTNDSEAEVRARTYLERHDNVELWIDHRRIARLKRDD